MGRSRSGEPLVRRPDLSELETTGLVLEIGHQTRRASATYRRPTPRASRGVSDASVSMSITKRSKSVDCSTRTGSTENATRRTGEKMESTGITPMVLERLFLSAEAYPLPRSTVTSMARRPLALSEAMWSSGFSTSTSAVSWRSPAVTSPGPRLSQRNVTGSSLCTRKTMSFRFKMMSVTSSFTPGRVVNSCRASSKRTWVTAAPGMADSKRAPDRVPERVAESGLERADGKALPVLLFFSDGLDGRSLDDEHVGSPTSSRARR